MKVEREVFESREEVSIEDTFRDRSRDGIVLDDSAEGSERELNCCDWSERRCDVPVATRIESTEMKNVSAHRRLQ